MLTSKVTTVTVNHRTIGIITQSICLVLLCYSVSSCGFCRRMWNIFLTSDSDDHISSSCFYWMSDAVYVVTVTIKSDTVSKVNLLLWFTGNAELLESRGWV